MHTAGVCLVCPTAQPTAPDSLLCYRCSDRVRDSIDPDYAGDLDYGLPPSIPRLYNLLSPVKDGGGDGGRRAPGFGSVCVINTHAVSLMDPRSKANGRAWSGADGRTHWEPENGLLHAPTVFAGWIGMVIQDRPISVPRPPWTLDRLARVLAAHWPWCSGQPWVPDMLAELSLLHGQLRTAVQAKTGERRPYPIGRCPATPGGVRCAAPLWAPRGGGGVSCASCGAYWPRSSWTDWTPDAAEADDAA